jgi:hypothetical protein
VLFNSLTALCPKRRRQREQGQGEELFNKIVLILKAVNNSKDWLQGQPVLRQLYSYVIILKEELANILLNLLP